MDPGGDTAQAGEGGAAAALYGFATGTRLLPAIFVIQAVCFFGIGRYLHGRAREPAIGDPAR